MGYSDYRLHLFCLQSGSKRLLKHQLHPREVRPTCPSHRSCWIANSQSVPKPFPEVVVATALASRRCGTVASSGCWRSCSRS